MLLYNELSHLYFPLEFPLRDFAAELRSLRNLARRYSARTLLDAGCGTGEHVHALRESGLRAVGADRSSSMIRTARSRFPQCEFRVVEMEHLGLLSSSHIFDFVYTLCGSFNYLVGTEEVRRSLLQIRSLLRPGSPFLLDFWNTAPFRWRPSSPSHVHVQIRQEGREVRRFRSYRLLEGVEGEQVEVEYRYEIEGEVRRDRHLIRVFSRLELEEFVREAGFRLQGVYGSFDGLHDQKELRGEDPLSGRLLFLLEA